jgi:hypothetical protein
VNDKRLLVAQLPEAIRERHFTVKVGTCRKVDGVATAHAAEGTAFSMSRSRRERHRSAAVATMLAVCRRRPKVDHARLNWRLVHAVMRVIDTSRIPRLNHGLG